MQDGYWTSWSEWAPKCRDCGNVNQTRTRTCTNANGGKNCTVSGAQIGGTGYESRNKICGIPCPGNWF